MVEYVGNYLSRIVHETGEAHSNLKAKRINADDSELNNRISKEYKHIFIEQSLAMKDCFEGEPYC